MKRKALSILLALSMIMTFMPAMALTAFADDEAVVEQVEVQKNQKPEKKWEDPFAEQRAAAIEDINEAVKDCDSDAAKQAAASGIEWVKKAWTLDGITAIKEATIKTVGELEEAADTAQGKLATAAGDDAKGAVLALYQTYFDKIYDVDNVNLKGKTPQERMAAIGEEGVAAIQQMQAWQKKATEDVNAEGFNASLFALTDGEKAELEQIAQDIVDGKIFGYDGIYWQNFGQMKKEVTKKIYSLTDEQAKDATEEEKAAVLDAQKAARKAVAEATTYAELLEARNVGLTNVEKAIAPQFDKEVLTVNAKTYGRKAVRVSWNKVEGATSYTVYAAQCGKKYKKVATTTSTSFKLKKIGKKKLKAHKDYKFYVVANNGVKGNTVHFITAKTRGKYANVKNMSAKSTATLKKNSNTNASAKYYMSKKKKHIKKNHGAAFTYATDNAYVATVSSNGTITANHCGTANITVYEIGGLSKVVKVTVDGYEATVAE